MWDDAFYCYFFVISSLKYHYPSPTGIFDLIKSTYLIIVTNSKLGYLLYIFLSVINFPRSGLASLPPQMAISSFLLPSISFLDSSIFIGFIVSIDYFLIHKFLQLYKCDTKLMDLFMLVVVSFNLTQLLLFLKPGF